MSMNPKSTYLLLKIVKNNGNVKRLIHENLNFKEIADLTNIAMSEGLIIFNNENLILSALGEKKYSELLDKFKEQNKDKWIEKEIESKIPRLEKDFIFLPDQNELDF